jgi:hypothetical protein
VIAEDLELMMVDMERNLVSLDRVIHWPEGVTDGAFAGLSVSSAGSDPLACGARRQATATMKVSPYETIDLPYSVGAGLSAQ